jgi:hypothetical protein
LPADGLSGTASAHRGTVCSSSAATHHPRHCRACRRVANPTLPSSGGGRDSGPSQQKLRAARSVITVTAGALRCDRRQARVTPPHRRLGAAVRVWSGWVDEFAPGRFRWVQFRSPAPTAARTRLPGHLRLGLGPLPRTRLELSRIGLGLPPARPPFRGRPLAVGSGRAA